MQALATASEPARMVRLASRDQRRTMLHKPPGHGPNVERGSRSCAERRDYSLAHLMLAVGGYGEQDPNQENIALAAGFRVVGSEGTGRLVLPVAAQSHCDRRADGFRVAT